MATGGERTKEAMWERIRVAHHNAVAAAGVGATTAGTGEDASWAGGAIGSVLAGLESVRRLPLLPPEATYDDSAPDLEGVKTSLVSGIVDVQAEYALAGPPKEVLSTWTWSQLMARLWQLRKPLSDKEALLLVFGGLLRRSNAVPAEGGARWLAFKVELDAADAAMLAASVWAFSGADD